MNAPEAVWEEDVNRLVVAVSGIEPLTYGL